MLRLIRILATGRLTVDVRLLRKEGRMNAPHYAKNALSDRSAAGVGKCLCTCEPRSNPPQANQPACS